MQGSKPFAMPSKDEWISLGLTTLKVAGAAGATYFLQKVSEHDWGDYKALSVIIIAAAFDFLHKWMPDTRTPDQKK